MCYRQFLVLVLIVLLAAPTSLAAVRGKKAMYIGGTAAIPEKTKGVLDVSGDESAVFTSEKGQVLLKLPFASISSFEYGQYAARRIKSGKAVAGSVAGAVAVGVFAAPVVVPLLLTKRRQHYLTIVYTDAEGTEQLCVFELSKKIVRTTINTLEVRTGKEVQFESEEAKKHLTQVK